MPVPSPRVGPIPSHSPRTLTLSSSIPILVPIPPLVLPRYPPSIFIQSSHSHTFSLAEVREPSLFCSPLPPPSALLPGSRFFLSNHPIDLRPHRLIKGHSLRVSSFTPLITHVTESYDSIQRGFAPSSWLRAILAHIHHRHF